MASDGTGCFPSCALIAEESGLGRSTVSPTCPKSGRCRAPHHCGGNALLRKLMWNTE
ncbi:hypothetical protein [Rhizobium laguerreae]|uniref:hypothetical protein n=1 Tax=Rhizobium laguerreae TaxID=1076926 RepID=UPI0039C71E30